MAVICPTYNMGQFSKPTRMRSYMTRKRIKDYSKPLHVDCSVEYELPNSAKPPTGSKNEPLLMIHPSYYRREESKTRSQFVNNLPKKRSSSRICNASGTSTNTHFSSVQYGVACVANANRTQFHQYDKHSAKSIGLSPALPPPSATVFQKGSTLFPPADDFLNVPLRIKTYPQQEQISAVSATSSQQQSKVYHDVSHRNLLNLWNKSVGCGYPQTPSTPANSQHTWFPTSIKPADISNNNDKCRDKTQERLYSSDVPVVPSHQQQPSVAVAAVAPPLNYPSCCPPYMRPALNNSETLLPQPWSATPAPDFPLNTLPTGPPLMVHMELPGSGSAARSTRKRTAGMSWWHESAPVDALPAAAKRNKSTVDENVGASMLMDNRFNGSQPNSCNCCNYNVNCGSAVANDGSLWNRPNENPNLNLFRL